MYIWVPNFQQGLKRWGPIGWGAKGLRSKGWGPKGWHFYNLYQCNCNVYIWVPSPNFQWGLKGLGPTGFEIKRGWDQKI